LNILPQRPDGGAGPRIGAPSRRRLRQGRAEERGRAHAGGNPPAQRELRPARHRRDRRIDGRLPQRRSHLSQRLLAVAHENFRPRALSAGQEPRRGVRQAGCREGVLPDPFAHVGDGDGVQPSVVRGPRPGGDVRPPGRPARPAPGHCVSRTAWRYDAAGPGRAGAADDGGVRASGPSTAVNTPPRLIARTLTVTFATVAVILTIAFIVITLDVRNRVRASETEKLRVSENVFTALESKRQQDQVAAMATLAENPTLKAALDTYFTERRFSGSSDAQLRATVNGETAKLASQTPADVLAVVENDGRIFTSAGPSASQWVSGEMIEVPRGPQATFQSVAVVPTGAFRVTGARLTFGDRAIGMLVAGTSLDATYAQELSNLSTAGVVITVNNSVVARTVPETVARDLVASKLTAGTATLGAEEYAIRTMLASGPARIYTLTSIDAAARNATRDALVAVGLIAFGSFILAA